MKRLIVIGAILLAACAAKLPPELSQFKFSHYRAGRGVELAINIDLRCYAFAAGGGQQWHFECVRNSTPATPTRIFIDPLQSLPELAEFPSGR